MTVFKKMMTQSVKIVKVKEVIQMILNTIELNDDNDSLKKDGLTPLEVSYIRIITIILYIYI